MESFACFCIFDCRRLFGIQKISSLLEQGASTPPKKSKDQIVINLTHIETPLGEMIACATEEGVCLLEFSDRKTLDAELKYIAKSLDATIVEAENKYFEELRRQLNEYFEGSLKEFTVPLLMLGTDFQKQAWQALLHVPYGTTVSYSQQAMNVGKPSAVRAIANANGMNKIAIVVPCHRLIGADGSLTGYSGGLWRKQKLLELERNIILK